MTNQHPITPPPELVQQWLSKFYGKPVNYVAEGSVDLAARAAQWGADQELEACCEWLHWQNLATHPELIPSLRAALRPQPPSLKEQSIALIDRIQAAKEAWDISELDTIRRALEQLDD